MQQKLAFILTISFKALQYSCTLAPYWVLVDNMELYWIWYCFSSQMRVWQNNSFKNSTLSVSPTESLIHQSIFPGGGGGGVLLYLGMVGRFRSDDPLFCNFRSDWVPMLWLNQIRWPPLSAEKLSLSISHLVPEILGHKGGLIFH